MNFHRAQFDINRVSEKKQFLVIQIHHIIVLNMRNNKLHYSFFNCNFLKLLVNKVNFFLLPTKRIYLFSELPCIKGYYLIRRTSQYMNIREPEIQTYIEF